MRGHGAGDKPSRCEDESEDRHRTTWSWRCFSFNLGRADRRRRTWDQEPVQGQAGFIGLRLEKCRREEILSLRAAYETAVITRIMRERSERWKGKTCFARRGRV
jgi:hypothetical protein